MPVATEKLYKIGDVVLESGNYVCAPCGYIQYFEKGTDFTACLACLAGTPDGPEGFQDESSEFWQFFG